MTVTKVQTARAEHTTDTVRIIVTAVCEAFAVFSLIRFSLESSFTNIFLSLATVFLVLIPVLIEKVFHCRIATAVYVWASLYAVGPLLGEANQLYFILPWWDKLLHCCGGMAFALAGYYIPELLNKGKPVSRTMRIVFAVCFSVAVAALWEFYEFGGDRLFGTDMQQDRYVTTVNSYFLADSYGVVGTLGKIESVGINGEEIPGYIDIGLIDTMGDMMIETFGAILAAAFFVWDKERHPIICPALDKNAQTNRSDVVCQPD